MRPTIRFRWLPNMDLATANQVMNVVSSAVQTCATEMRNIEVIRAQSREVVAQINARRDAILEFIKGRFAERAATLDHLFETLSEAVRVGDTTAYAGTLSSIEGILKANFIDDVVKLDRDLASGEFSFSLPSPSATKQ